MEITTEEDVRVKFTVKEDDGTTFTDALYLKPAERAALTDEELAVRKMERFANWRASVEAAKNAPPFVPTPEEVLAGIDSLVLESERLDVQVSALTRAEFDAARVRVGLTPVTRTR